MKRILFFCCIFLISCSFAKGDSYKTITVKQEPITTPLFFSGKINPLRITNIASPAEGVVIDIKYKYGQTIEKGAILFNINSTKLETDYHTALSSYLQAKDTYNVSDNSFKGTTELYKLGIISENEFITKRSERAKSYVAYLESLYNLEETIKTGQQITEDIKSIDISDYAKVDKALNIKYNYLTIAASSSGVLLEPPKGTDSASGPVEVGSQVKLGRVLGVIGDMSGLSVDISVSEIDVLRIKKGQAVLITGPAFPDLNLKGEVVRIDQQAITETTSGGLPSFAIEVQVKNLNPKALQEIRVGMSAKVKVDIAAGETILIPIKAVSRKDNAAFVQVLKNGKPEKRKIVTGLTTLNKVEVKQGLKVGERIVIPD